MPYFFSRLFVVPWNKFYRREYLVRLGVEFDNLKCANDRAFYFKTVLSARKITLLSRTLMAYRVGNNNSLVGSTRYKHF